MGFFKRSYRPVKPSVSYKLKGQAHGKKFPSITLKCQGHAHVFIRITLWSTSLAIFLILYLNINSMSTKPSKFWNSELNNNCHPQKTCSIPLCSSCHCYLAQLRNLFGYLHLAAQFNTAALFGHPVLLITLITLIISFSCSSSRHCLPATSCHKCTKPDVGFSSRLRSRNTSLLLKPGLVFVENKCMTWAF